MSEGLSCRLTVRPERITNASHHHLSEIERETNHRVKGRGSLAEICIRLMRDVSEYLHILLRLLNPFHDSIMDQMVSAMEVKTVSNLHVS